MSKKDATTSPLNGLIGRKTFQKWNKQNIGKYNSKLVSSIIRATNKTSVSITVQIFMSKGFHYRKVLSHEQMRMFVHPKGVKPECYKRKWHRGYTLHCSLKEQTDKNSLIHMKRKHGGCGKKKYSTYMKHLWYLGNWEKSFFKCANWLKFIST